MPELQEVDKEVLKDVPKTEEGEENNVLEQVPVQPQQGNKTEEEEEIQLPENMDLFPSIDGQGQKKNEIKEPDTELSEDTEKTEDEEIKLPKNEELLADIDSQGKEGDEKNVQEKLSTEQDLGDEKDGDLDPFESMTPTAPAVQQQNQNRNQEEGEHVVGGETGVNLRPSVEVTPTAPVVQQQVQNRNQQVGERDVVDATEEHLSPSVNVTQTAPVVQQQVQNRNQQVGDEERGNNVQNNLARDNIREDIRDLSLQVTNENGVLVQGGGGGEEAFDTLNELKAIRDVEPEEEEEREDQEDVPDSGNARDENLDKLRKDVQSTRKGNLYTAVVLARALEKGDTNLLAGRNRFSRFLKSSKVNAAADVAADVGKTVGAISGMVGNFDTNYLQSNACAAVSLVTNMLGLVTSIRDFVKKIREFKAIRHEENKKNEKVFGMIGILCEGFSLITKLCSIGKAIATFAGEGKGLFARVMTYVTLAGGFAAQLGGMASAINGMIQAQKKVKQMETMRGGLGRKVEDIFQKYKAIDEQSSVQQENHVDSTDVDSSDAESDIGGEGTPITEQTAGTPQTSVVTGNTPQQGGLQTEEDDVTTNRRKALALLERTDLTEDEKDKLIEYLMWSRRIDKVRLNTSDVGLSMLTLVSGMASGVAASIHVSKMSADSQKGVQIFGTAAGGLGVISTANKYAKKIAEKRESKYDFEGKGLQNMAHDALGELNKDDYGLKRVAASLINPNKDQKEEAGKVLSKYAAVDKRLQSLGVKYGPLLKASNKKEFDQLLVAGI